MAARLQELKAVLALMREARATRVKLGTLEVELSPLAFALPSAPSATAGTPAPVGVENGGEPTEEQLLYWSTSEMPAVKQEERQ